jgi:hypothetical protein
MLGVLLFSIQHSFSANPDEWSGPNESILFSHWSVNLSIGFTSYFGDLSQYDENVIHKLLYESKPAYGLKLTKEIKSFGVSGQVIYGGFKSNYKPEHCFDLSMIEYSIQAEMNVINVIFRQKEKKYGLDAYVGIGQFIFNTSTDGYFDGQQIPNAYSTGVPEFVYFFGCEFFVNVTDQVRFTSNLSIRQIQNDNIDKYLAHDDFDYYSLLNFGLSYSFGKWYKPVNDQPRQGINDQEALWR